MQGRMIHTLTGRLDSQRYDRDGQVCTQVCITFICLTRVLPQCINSINRTLLNVGLLDEVAASNKIKIQFNHKVIAVDFDRKFITIKDMVSNLNFESDFDLCVGADGSYSTIRQHLMRVVRRVAALLLFYDGGSYSMKLSRMDYSQEYITDEYIELKMPAGCDADGQPVFPLDPNHLHIWPRQSFMLIALPNRVSLHTRCLRLIVSLFHYFRRTSHSLALYLRRFPCWIGYAPQKLFYHGFINIFLMQFLRLEKKHL
jgi:kynurenine 3-monooxygenase